MPVSDNIEEELWDSAEKMRGQVEASDYKHIVLGLLFLRDASLRFQNDLEEVKEEYNIEDESKNKEMIKAYLSKDGSFYLPEEARWEYIKNSEKSMSEKLDNAMEAIMEENKSLEGSLPKRYRQVSMKEESLEKLFNKFERISMNIREDEDTDEDFVGRIYEYFIKQFAIETAQGSGEFYTPQDVVELLVRTLRPLKGRIFDPCAGTGGMFVQSYEYVKENEDYDADKMTFYGQEINNALISLARMNMALRGLLLDSNLVEGDSLLNDRMPELVGGDKLNASKVITNPPFNYSYDSDKIDPNDPRFPYGLPNEGNANYAFLQHMLYHADDKGGMVGTVMANGALSNDVDDNFRESLLEDDLIDVIITLPEKLFYSVDLPVSIFILSKGKGKYNSNHREREGETLFIDASDMYSEVSKSEHRLNEEHIKKIARAVRSYRGDIPEEISVEFENNKGFSRVVEKEEIESKRYNLNPGRYIEYEVQEGYTPLRAKIPELQGKLNEKFDRSRELEQKVNKGLKNLKEKGDKSE
jgi:type I restriction enzyme M protein